MADLHKGNIERNHFECPKHTYRDEKTVSIMIF